MEKSKLVWGKYECKSGKAFEFNGGSCNFFIKRDVNSWLIANQSIIAPSDTLSFAPTIDIPEKLNTNVFQTGRSDQLVLLPSLPVKSVVFRPAKQISISPRQSFRLYLFIPLNVQIYYGQADPEHLMAEHELIRLSDTWFGETDSGEAAFSIGSDFFSPFTEQPQQKSHEVLCPIKINNTSGSQMDLQRLIIRVENLNIYRKNNLLISSLVSIDFKGPDTISNIHFSTEKAIHGENPTLVAHQRNTGSKTILGKSFYFIKHFTQ